jgi:hypothetical protein
VIRPQPFYPRLSLAEAEEFLRQCLLGQTERGSFSVTVGCPLGAVPGAEAPAEPVPFARRVTVFLMRALERLSRAVDAGDVEALLDPAAGEPVLSANLCEGLLEMTPEGEGSALTVSADWARTLPPPADAGWPRSVRLSRERFPQIEALASRLRPTPAPQRQTFLGLVEGLNGRPNAAGGVEGEVWLTLLDPEGETVRVRADLNAADYKAAVEAHLRALPVTLQGVLRRGARVARIEEVTEFKVYPRLAEHPASA